MIIICPVCDVKICGILIYWKIQIIKNCFGRSELSCVNCNRYKTHLYYSSFYKKELIDLNKNYKLCIYSDGCYLYMKNIVGHIIWTDEVLTAKEAMKWANKQINKLIC